MTFFVKFMFPSSLAHCLDFPILLLYTVISGGISKTNAI